MYEIRSAVYVGAFLVGVLGATLLVHTLKEARSMFGLGKNQGIMVVGGLVVLVGGFVALLVMQPEQAQSFLDFAGPFGWKIIVGALGGSAVIKAAGALGKPK